MGVLSLGETSFRTCILIIEKYDAPAVCVSPTSISIDEFWGSFKGRKSFFCRLCDSTFIRETDWTNA